MIRAELGGWSRDGMVRQAAFKGVEAGRDPLDGRTRERRSRPPPRSRPPKRRHHRCRRNHRSRSRRHRRRSQATPKRRPSKSKARRARRPTSPPPGASPTTSSTALDALGKEGVWQRRGGRAEADQPRQAARSKPGRGPSARSPSASSSATSRGSRRRCCRHLQDRPLNLQRFPNGAGAPGFWQKDIPETAPTWLTRWHETGVDGRADRDANDHLIADRAATLCWLGNQASFEIHAWTGRLPDAWQPDLRATSTSTPGEKTTWDETLVLARLYRTALGHLGVRGYPKMTGKRGIQVWIPIVPKYTFSETSAWVERVSRAVGATVPDLVSWEWAKEARKGRARLDYTQNASIKTLVAPYAVRPAPGAPGLRADRLGRAGRPGPAARPLDDPRRSSSASREVGDLFAPAQTDAQELPEV